MHIKLLAITMFLAWIVSSSAAAFNPPEDTDLPLHIRIDGPAKITEVDKPIPVRVTVENRSDDARMTGAVRLEVIDAWRVEPEKAAPFELEAKSSTTIDATITAGAGTYNATYPLHAYAEAACGQSGYERKVHAILLMDTQLPNPPKPAIETMPWQPVSIRADSECLLLRLPCFRTLIQVNGETAHVCPVGWHGVDGRTRASVEPFVAAARPDSREAIGIHPPWFNGMNGSALIEYPLQLPDGQSIHLKFANAIRDSMPPEPLSDGVTFRIRVAPLDTADSALGDVVYERFTDAKTWQDADVDLSAFAGKAIRVQLESNPGPRNDTTCDQSYWAAPTLIAGSPKKPTEVALGEAVELGNIHVGDAAFGVEWRPGTYGLLDGRLTFSNRDGKQLTVSGFRVNVAGAEAGQYVVAVTGVSQTFDKGILRVMHHLRKQDVTVDLVGEMQLVNGAGLQVRFSLEHVPEARPWNVVRIEDVAAGPWNETLQRVYAGVGNVMEDPQAFNMGFDGHQLATSAVGFDFANGMSLVQSVDVSPNRFEVTPSSRQYTLHAPLNVTMGFFPARDVWQGARAYRTTDTRPASDGVKTLAGRFVFDLWGGRYAASKEALAQAFLYGLTDSVVVWHNWQSWGYDYRLPNIVPPNREFGTLEEFKALADTCKQRGVIFAPHDNYIDFYPDADGFSYERIAFTQNGEPIRAWLNEYRGAQAYRWRTDSYWPLMEKNIQWLKENVAPTGYFIDVFSSIGPYDSWTFDGQFQDRVFTRDTWGKTFAWIREQLGDNAPQISESGHDQLVGYLDGSQCNHLRVDAHPPKEAPWAVWQIQCADSERVPWLDMLVHDRFVAHGAGYESRFRAGLDPDLHGIFSDDYMSVEMLDGHPAMVPEPFSRNVVRKYWLLHEAGRALAMCKMQNVTFDNGDMHKAHVEWENDSNVWVNRGNDTWNVNGHELPTYGFLAATKEVEAAIERRDGVIVEWSRSPEAYYVNARSHLDDKLPLWIADAQVDPAEGRKVRVRLRWHAEQPTNESMALFAHFVDNSGKIIFQADLQPPVPTNEWRGDIETVSLGEWPANVTAGDSFELRVGMHRPDIGRAALRGPCDHERRIRVGTLRLDGTSAAWTPLPPQPDPFAERGNPTIKSVGFDGIVTNGGCRITRDGDALIVTPLPEHPAFVLQFTVKHMPFDAPTPTRATPISADGVKHDQVPLTLEDDAITLTTTSNMFAYRLEP